MTSHGGFLGYQMTSLDGVEHIPHLASAAAFETVVVVVVGSVAVVVVVVGIGVAAAVAVVV